MKKTLYITDKQYLELLQAIRKDLDQIKDIQSDDCNMTGNKHTMSNVGLCTGREINGWMAANHLTRETAMWPEDFDTIGKSKYPYPQQYTRKYKEERHKCPLDRREIPGLNGCFYSCMLFHPKKKEVLTIDKIKQLYDEQIEKAQKGKLQSNKK